MMGARDDVSSTTLWFRLLGGLQVERDGETIELAARRQRALLGLLLLNTGRVVPVDRLIDQLWSEQPPAAASATLQAYISQLRRVLEPDRPARAPAQVLVTRDPGYSLRVEPAQLDTLNFERLAREGHAALGTGDAEGADRVFTEALDLWRGGALADFADEPWAAAALAHLREAHSAAVEGRIDAWLALGRHARAVA